MLYQFFILFFSILLIGSNAYCVEKGTNNLIQKRMDSFNANTKSEYRPIKPDSNQIKIDSETAPGSQNFYEQKKEGYYWYQDPKEKEQKKKQSLPENKQSFLKYEELWNMHPDEFQELMKSQLKEAVRLPTEENVLYYLTMQDIAQKKATAFAAVVGLVGQKNPTMFNEASYPTNRPGQKAYIKDTKNSIDDTLLNEKNNYALIMFTNQGCSYCEEQKGILEYFKTAYRWEIKELELKDHMSLASQFKVEITPTIIMVARESGEHIPISAGVVSVNDLTDRLYRSIKYLKGEIKPEQYYMKTTKPNDSGNPLYKPGTY